MNSLVWLHMIEAGGHMVDVLLIIQPGGIVIPPIARDLAAPARALGIRVFGRQPGINNDEWFTAPQLAAEFGDSMEHIESLCTPSEPECETPDQVKKCNEFDLQFARDCHAIGVKACVRNWGDGRPGGSWEGIGDLLGYYVEAEAAGDYDGRHIYNQAGFAPTAPESWPWHMGRLQWERGVFLHRYGITPPPNIPTEMGWDQAIKVDGEWLGWRWVHDEKFVPEMDEAYRRLSGHIEGGALFVFGTGGNPKWTWNNALEADGVPEQIAVLAQKYPYVSPEPQPDEEGDEMVDTKLNAEKTIAEMNKVKETLGTFLTQAIDPYIAEAIRLQNEIIASPVPNSKSPAG